MTIKKAATILTGSLLAVIVGSSAWAQLTPMGADKAGNRDGSIPAWTGGISSPPSGYEEGKHLINPYPDDKVMFTITGENVDRYKDKLSPGQLAMFKTYKTYKMNVYKSRRTAAFPKRIYDAVLANERKAKLVDGGNGVADAEIGIPFRRPKDGHEVLWNHLLRYRGGAVARHLVQAAPTRGGAYTLVKLEDEFDLFYSKPGTKFEDLNNRFAYFKQKVVAPARLAGYILLVHETINQVKEPRSAWTYNTGQRRVRRAPNVAYDNPGTASDAQRTSDQLDMFNGAPNRYDWKLVGKQELYVPYNSYKLHSPELEYSDILTPLHINQDHVRYELHRVWKVEATLKEGKRHIYKRRTFYFDEDSWQALIVDQYDNRDQLWRVSEGYALQYYNEPCLWTTLETHYDLQNGRYLAMGLYNQEPMYDFSLKRTAKDYTPSVLRREGTR